MLFQSYTSVLSNERKNSNSYVININYKNIYPTTQNAQNYFKSQFLNVYQFSKKVFHPIKTKIVNKIRQLISLSLSSLVNNLIIVHYLLADLAVLDCSFHRNILVIRYCNYSSCHHDNIFWRVECSSVFLAIPWKNRRWKRMKRSNGI